MTNEQFLLDSNTSISKSIELASTPIQIVDLSRGLDLRQQRFFNMAILTVDENGISEFGHSEYVKVFNDDGDNFYSKKIRKDITALGTLGILESGSSIRWRNIFAEVVYDTNIKRFRFVWSHLMLEHVLNLNKNFIQQDLKVLANFKNKYSYIWYDYFKSRFRQWKWVLTKEQIVEQLRLHNKKSYLRNHSMFFKQCIEIPIQELNDYTEYTIEYNIIRNGKNIEGYEFRRYTNATVTKTVSDKQLGVLREICDRYGDKNMILTEIDKYSNRNRELADKLRELFSDIYSYNRLILVSSKFSTEEFSFYVSEAIRKDNLFKKLMKDLVQDEYLYQESLFELDDDQEVNKKRSGFYNWLDERE